jgi:hypothetical protein
VPLNSKLWPNNLLRGEELIKISKLFWNALAYFQNRVRVLHCLRCLVERVLQSETHNGRGSLQSSICNLIKHSM